MVYYNILGVFDITVVGGWFNIRGKEAAGPDVIVEVGEGGALRVQSRAWELQSPRGSQYPKTRLGSIGIKNTSDPYIPPNPI